MANSKSILWWERKTICIGQNAGGFPFSGSAETHYYRSTEPKTQYSACPDPVVEMANSAGLLVHVLASIQIQTHVRVSVSAAELESHNLGVVLPFKKRVHNLEDE